MRGLRKRARDCAHALQSSVNSAGERAAQAWGLVCDAGGASGLGDAHALHGLGCRAVARPAPRAFRLLPAVASLLT